MRFTITLTPSAIIAIAGLLAALPSDSALAGGPGGGGGHGGPVGPVAPIGPSGPRAFHGGAPSGRWAGGSYIGPGQHWESGRGRGYVGGYRRFGSYGYRRAGYGVATRRAVVPWVNGGVYTGGYYGGPGYVGGYYGGGGVYYSSDGYYDRSSRPASYNAADVYAPSVYIVPVPALPPAPVAAPVCPAAAYPPLEHIRYLDTRVVK